MRTLLLLRHGKAVASDSEGDRDRALNDRGRHQAAAIAPLLDRLGLQPDVALVSDAVRTKQTADLALAGSKTQVRLEPDLYAAPAQGILGAIRSVAGNARRILVVGHNPGIGELARLLEGSGEPQAVIALHQSFPTGALAVFEFDVPAWADLGPGSGTLTRFIVPDLSAAEG